MYDILWLYQHGKRFAGLTANVGPAAETKPAALEPLGAGNERSAITGSGLPESALRISGRCGKREKLNVESTANLGWVGRDTAWVGLKGPKLVSHNQKP